MEAKAKSCLFVGYDELTKGFRIWVPSDRKLIISRNVRFDDSSVLNSTQIQPPLSTIPVVTGTNSLQPSNFNLTDQPIDASMPTPPSPLSQIPQNLPNIESTNYQNSATQSTSSTTQSNPCHPSNNIPLDHLPAPEINTRPTSVRQPSVKLKDSYIYSVKSKGSNHPVATPVELIQLFEPIENSCFFGIIEEPSKPLTFAEANAHLGWRVAMKSESDSLTKNQTWELCDLPPGIKLVTSKWIYKTKIGADKQPSKLKV